jgi:hypothetical protein
LLVSRSLNALEDDTSLSFDCGVEHVWRRTCRYEANGRQTSTRLSESFAANLLIQAAQILLQILQFASVIATGLMMWKGLGLVTNTESPIVVVLRFIFSGRVRNLSLILRGVVRLCYLQRFYGASILPRRPSLLEEPQGHSLHSWRHNSLQDTWRRDPYRAPCH